MAGRLGRWLARRARWAGSSSSSSGSSEQGWRRPLRHSARPACAAALPAVLACQYLDGRRSSCEGGSSSSGGSSIIRFRVDVDRPGLLSEATEVLKKQQVNIRDARISTEEGSKRATHIYFVEESGERTARGGGGLSEERLAEVRAALTQLASGSCEAEPWPVFSSEEVAKHQTPSNGIWVSYKDGVYDITDFVQNHPGGKDKIMLAAGKAIDPFWRIYQQHTGRGNALELLESMRIGDLSDPPDTTRTASDPYDSDPERHPGLIFHNNKPCNAELPSELMMDSWLTPNPVWFIRHHHPVPEVKPEDYRLCIEGVGTKAVTLCLEDLKKRFLKREVVATLQCGGNRRSELDQIEKTSGIPWGFGAMSTAQWGGVYLREVLQHCAGLSHENVEAFDVKHVIFKGMDGMEASIPIEKALSPYGDVLLAYEMNGEALPNEHGAPVRVIVPGVVGVRNVKWLGRVVASTEEAEGPWQRGLAYKGFSPMVKELQGIDVEKIPSMHELPVQSAIVSPKPGSVTELDDLEVKGFAWSGGGRGIVRVDVSIDEGKTWITAELADGKDQCYNRAWAWTFWEASVPVPAELQGKEFTVLCRAVDSAYSTQPERPEPLWNLRGLNCNCWHRVPVRHQESLSEFLRVDVGTLACVQPGCWLALLVNSNFRATRAAVPAVVVAGLVSEALNEVDTRLCPRRWRCGSGSSRAEALRLQSTSQPGGLGYDQGFFWGLAELRAKQEILRLRTCEWSLTMCCRQHCAPHGDSHTATIRTSWNPSDGRGWLRSWMPHWQKRLQQPLANVFCLQEVDELWASKLHSHFQRRGWHFAYAMTPLTYFPPIGVALAFPGDLELEELLMVRPAAQLKLAPSRSPSTRWQRFKDWILDHMVRNRTDEGAAWTLAARKQNRLLAAKLKVKSLGCSFVVATYHMPCLFDEPLQRQAKAIHAALVRDALMLHFPEEKSLVLAGDFNTKPEDSELQVLTEGVLAESDVAWPAALTDQGLDFAQWQAGSGSLQLRSAYAQRGGEPEYTNYAWIEESPTPFRATLDYIFTAAAVEVVDVHRPPLVPQGDPVFPTAEQPSDHVLLAADLSL
eukprot:s988_g10.t4